MEAYHLFQEGFDWHLNREDVSKLGGATDKFEEYSMEYELIQKYFHPPKGVLTGELSASEIQIILENKSGIRMMSLKRIGMELKKLGYNSIIQKENGKARRLYPIIERMIGSQDVSEVPGSEDLPF